MELRPRLFPFEDCQLSLWFETNVTIRIVAGSLVVAYDAASRNVPTTYSGGQNEKESVCNLACSRGRTRGVAHDGLRRRYVCRNMESEYRQIEVQPGTRAQEQHAKNRIR